MKRSGSCMKWALLAAAVAVFGFAVQPAFAGQGYTRAGGDGPDPPLTLFASHTLASPFGSIQAVVYDGNELVNNSTNTTPISGFTVPAPPFTAMTTYVVVDGQCGPAAPNGCVSTAPTGGSGDLLRFTGGNGTFSNGPDAFKGSDGCPWGADTCLWDTRTFDVSLLLSPGNTSASVDVQSTTAADGTDCINHETQIFAVGPTPAWALAGYKTDGVGLRNQGMGTVTIVGIPPGTQVVAAYLYWNILNPTVPAGTMVVNGVPTPGTMFKTGGDPCWDGGSHAFRADVTAVVAPTGGNGAYVLSGYPTGSITGTSPWLGSPTPMMEGASLAVFFEACPNDDDLDDDGLENKDEGFFSTTLGDDDSDDDGIRDGDDDSDDDGEDDEDEDDGPGECPADGDGDGEDDEDEDDEDDDD